MKKILIFALTVILLFSICNTVFAVQVDLPFEVLKVGNNKEEKLEFSENYSEYIQGRCQFTGVEYLKVLSSEETGPDVRFLYRSQDGVNWEFVREFNWKDKPKPMAETMLTSILSDYYASGVKKKIINIGNGYIASSEITYRGVNYSISGGWLGVYDEQFNPVHYITFDQPVMQLSYIDGVCYVVLFGDAGSPYTLMKSSDFVNWEEVGKDLGVPIRNGDKTIMGTYLREGAGLSNYDYHTVQNPILFADGSAAQPVALEGMDLTTLQVVGDFFMATNNTIGTDVTDKNLYLYYSKDGVYWAKQAIPATEESNGAPSAIESMKIDNGLLYLAIDGWENRLFYIFNVADLEATVPQSDTYVEVNGEILGFETPPIMENDRTLVPMRFLLEKLGADIGWYGESQMVVAQQNNMTVEMTIDNPVATVNGASVPMDIAPRLVNDKTMIPLRFLSENLGYNVEWNDETNTAVITTTKK